MSDDTNTPISDPLADSGVITRRHVESSARDRIFRQLFDISSINDGGT